MLKVLSLFAIFGAGLAVLYAGAEMTLRGAVAIATRIGISQLAIGLTLVAFGTSCPELALDVSAALGGTTNLAFGDLVGSNIANVGLILGAAALICPVKIRMQLLRAEVPIVISVSLLVLGLAVDGEISRQDGLIMVAVFVLFLGYSYRAARRESQEVRREFQDVVHPKGGFVWNSMLLLGGLLGLVAGAQLMVYSAVQMAALMGVSELIIGLTIVALGTSLPELATSVVAARRGDTDIVVGNVIGSNIFNLLLILAVVAVISPVPVGRDSLRVDLPVMCVLVIILAPIMLRGMVVSRKEGCLLMACYFGFLAWQVYVAVTSQSPV